MNRTPSSVSAIFILILLNAAFWLIFAILVALGAIESIPAGIIRWGIVILAFGCSAVLTGMVVFLKRRNRLAFYFSTIILAMIAILSITDEFGLPDLVTLLVCLVTLGLLLRERAWYLQTDGGTHN